MGSVHSGHAGHRPLPVRARALPGARRRRRVSASTPVTQRPVEQPTKSQRPRRHDEGSGRLAALLLSPTLIVLGLVVMFPIIMALRESLYKPAGVDPVTGFVSEGETYVGLDNYTAIFSGATGDRFWNAF